MAKQSIANITTKVVELLTPLSSEERQRVVQAALTLLGEVQVAQTSKAALDVDKGGTALEGIAPRAKAWLKQNGLTSEMVEQVFHIENGTVEVIATEIPGKGDKGKTLNVYILEGLGKFLATGDTKFEDKAARALCKHLGCYNDANHSVYLGDMGNKVTGSKEKGWKLTAPGLTGGAALIKEITKTEK